jgi:hypothetical protein
MIFHLRVLKQVGVDVAFVVPIFPIIIENNVQKEGTAFGLGLEGLGSGMFGGWFFHGVSFLAFGFAE